MKTETIFVLIGVAAIGGAVWWYEKQKKEQAIKDQNKVALSSPHQRDNTADYIKAGADVLEKAYHAYSGYGDSRPNDI